MQQIGYLVNVYQKSGCIEIECFCFFNHGMYALVWLMLMSKTLFCDACPLNTM